MIIHDCELWFAKVDPKRPNSKFNKENPTWELQIRTTDKDQKKDWEERGLVVKPVLPDEGEPYFRVNLRKKSIKKDGDKASPIRVVDSKLNPIDPNTIGNGSIGHVRVYQYEYTNKAGKPGIVSVLMGIQVTKHILYTPPPRDDEFKEEEQETEVIIPEESTDNSSEENTETPTPASAKDISL